MEVSYSRIILDDEAQVSVPQWFGVDFKCVLQQIQIVQFTVVNADDRIKRSYRVGGRVFGVLFARIDF